MEKLNDEQRSLLLAKRFKIYSPANPRRYYNYPDGQDLLGKLICTNKIMGAIGLFLGCSRCFSYPPIKGFGPKLFVISKYVIPCLGIATAFTFTTYHATNIRKKDDPWNHALGGLAAGAILRRTYFALAFAAICSGVKEIKLNGLDIFPRADRKSTFGSYFHRNKNLTLSSERKRTWTKELPTETEN